MKIAFTKSLWQTAAILCLLIFSVSCSDDNEKNNNPTNITVPYECASCTDSPDALPENDALAKGIYKGILIGSTGTLFIDIQNGSNTITATMVIDGDSILLTSSVETIDGEPYLEPFTGIYNGEPVSITFSVTENGGTPTVISSDIPGHPNADFVVVKENSQSLIEAFEGTYTKTGESGIFNILLSRGTINAWGGISRDNTSIMSEEIDGTITGNDLFRNGVFLATITGDVLQGTFVDEDLMTVTVNGLRTL